MFKQALKWIFANRKKEAHYLAALAGAIGTTWASSEKFREAVTKAAAGLPHWVQGFSAVIAFVIPIYKLAKKLAANPPADEAGAQ